MRTKTGMCFDWHFSMGDVGYEAALSGEMINIPHTWNAEDGQSGCEYYRGVCWYGREFDCPEMAQGDELWVEFRGVSASAAVWCNGKELAHHDGGYSIFRVNLTGELKEHNVLAVCVDNCVNDRVYPQQADFTFYGGIYREVFLITVSQNHFLLDNSGASGIRVTPVLDGKTAHVQVEAPYTGEGTVHVSLIDADGMIVGQGTGTDVTIEIDHVHRWNGRKDPYLYRARAELLTGDQVSDRVETSFGCRTFEIDPDKGFILNGEPYMLRGVAMHQDRDGVGNAVTPEMLHEDISIIAEMGANTIRLSHYQHSQYTLELCDRFGMVVWAEVPYISKHMDGGRENILSQLQELVVQCCNHPSIVVWGIGNEITMRTGKNHAAVDENMQALHDLAHRLDPSRLTVTASDYSVEHDDTALGIPDVISRNLYYGWYYGDQADLVETMDEWHRLCPERCIGLSEYGADAILDWQTPAPKKGDYTEAYQALIHEHALETVMNRPWIWATHVWNMFDFGAAHRSEGGKVGQNRKGLVTFDRKTRKDAFYAYKAWLSDEPFVHICGRRYVDRPEEVTEIKVYSNLDRVVLYDNDVFVAALSGKHVFRFTVPIFGEHRIAACAGNCIDVIRIRRTAKPNPTYSIVSNDIVNWVDRHGMPCPEGYHNVFSLVGSLLNDPDAGDILKQIIPPGMPPDIVPTVMGRNTVLDLLRGCSEDHVLSINAKLNEIQIKQML